MRPEANAHREVDVRFHTSSRHPLSNLQCRQMAQMRSADRIQKCLLFGVDRTCRRHVLNDANDPGCVKTRFHTAWTLGGHSVITCNSPLWPEADMRARPLRQITRWSWIVMLSASAARWISMS